MGQILQRSATTTEAVRRAIEHSSKIGLVDGREVGGKRTSPPEGLIARKGYPDVAGRSKLTRCYFATAAGKCG